MGAFAACYGELTSRWPGGLTALTLTSALVSTLVGIVIIVTCAQALPAISLLGLSVGWDRLHMSALVPSQGYKGISK
jgi:hypothetical protein